MDIICTIENISTIIETLKKIILPIMKRQVSETLEEDRIILLEGQMGAGKTTITRLLLNSIEPKLTVNSPTYNIFHEYKVNDFSFYHFDLYRIHSEDEVYDLGFEEIWGYRGISIIEWWNNVPSLFPENSILLDIKIKDENSRIYNLKRLKEFG